MVSVSPKPTWFWFLWKPDLSFGQQNVVFDYGFDLPKLKYGSLRNQNKVRFLYICEVNDQNHRFSFAKSDFVLVSKGTRFEFRSAKTIIETQIQLTETQIWLL